MQTIYNNWLKVENIVSKSPKTRPSFAKPNKKLVFAFSLNM